MSESETRKDFYVLSLRWTRTGDENATWWRPQNNGYTCSLDEAGRYTQEQIQQRPGYYNDRESTLAIPCDLVDQRARRILSTEVLSALVTETIGAPALVRAPRAEVPDDPRPLECPTCGQDRECRPGQSQIVLLPQENSELPGSTGRRISDDDDREVRQSIRKESTTLKYLFGSKEKDELGDFLAAYDEYLRGERDYQDLLPLPGARSSNDGK